MNFLLNVERPKFISVLTLVIVFSLVPVFIKETYVLHVLITVFIYIILTSAFRLIYNTGRISIGQHAFYSIGAYTTAILTATLGWNWWLALLSGALLAGLCAILIGFPSLRTRGVYFLMFTFAFGEVFRLISLRWKDLTGGAHGIHGVPNPNPIGQLVIQSPTDYYYFGLVLAILTIAIIYRIEVSRIGKIFSSLQGSEELAKAVGINTTYYYIMAFTIASVFAALTGGFLAAYNTAISPDNFTFWVTSYCVMYLIIGGKDHIAGPVVGAFILIIAPEFMHAVELQKQLVYGILLIIMMMFAPKGTVGLVLRISKGIRKTPMFGILLGRRGKG